MNLLEDIFLAILIIGIGGILTWAFLWWNALGTEPPEIKYAEGNIIQNNSLIAISPLPFTPPVVLSSLMECLIREESSGNPNAHNKEDPNGGSYGLLQFQKPTFQMYCVDKYGLEDNIWDENIQKQCCQMMLDEDEDNVYHWSTHRQCWNK